jgi:hypothetical protein
LPAVASFFDRDQPLAQQSLGFFFYVAVAALAVDDTVFAKLNPPGVPA